METPYASPSELSHPEPALIQASMSDIDEIRNIMQEASDFKKSRGDDLWGDEPFTDEEVGRMIISGNMYVHKIDDVIAASVILLSNDERMWGEDQGADDTALYIHKLVTGDAFRGQNLGVTVLTLAEELGRKIGKTRLRLDCPYDNEDLYEYYIRQGFHEVRRYERPSSPGRRNLDKDVFRAALLEREITVSAPST